MFSISAYQKPSRKDLRSFGTVLAVGFLMIAMWPVVVRDASPGRPALVISIASAVLGMAVPGVLGPFHRVWMFLGNVLGWVNSRVILALIFYFIVTPIRLALAIARKDPMNRSFEEDAETYRVVRQPREASHMDHQF